MIRTVLISSSSVYRPMLLLTIFQHLTPMDATENGISFKYLRRDFKLMKLSCTAEMPPDSSLSLIKINNVTASPSQQMVWIEGQKKPEMNSTFDDGTAFLAGRLSPDPARLDIVMTDYRPELTQTFQCEIGFFRSGVYESKTWSISVNHKDTSDENDTCRNQTIAVIVLALVLVILLVLAVIYLICQRRGRCMTGYKSTNGCLHNVPPSYSLVNDSHKRHEPIYSVSTLNRSQNSIYKARSNQGSIYRTNSCRQDGRNPRPTHPPPVPPSMTPRGAQSKMTLRSQTSIAESPGSKIPYAQPQDAIGQNLLSQDTGELPDTDMSSEFNSECPYIRYATPRDAEKRLSCSL